MYFTCSGYTPRATQQYNFVNIVLPSEFPQNLDETKMQFFDKKLIEGRMTQIW